MSENRKNNHETDNGDVARVFTCKPYGRASTAIRTVVLNTYIKKPTRSGKDVSAR